MPPLFNVVENRNNSTLASRVEESRLFHLQPTRWSDGPKKGFDKCLSNSTG